MNEEFVPHVVLDACVLANYAVCDVLLRLTEPPRLFEPRWSDEILTETIRTLETKLGWPRHLTAHLRSELDIHFRDAKIAGYEDFLPELKNHPKDRHVLAAAVLAGSHLVVTFNLRDFKPADTRPWGVTAVHPQDFLCDLFQRFPEIVLEKLKQQATDRNRTLSELLDLLGRSVPRFTAEVGGRGNLQNKQMTPAPR